MAMRLRKLGALTATSDLRMMDAGYPRSAQTQMLQVWVVAFVVLPAAAIAGHTRE